MTVPYEELAFWSTGFDGFTVDAGDYVFEIGASSSDIKASLTAFVDGEPVQPRCAETRVEAIDAEDYGSIQFLTDKTDNHTYIESKGMKMGYAVYPAFDLAGMNKFEAIVSSPAGQFDLLVIDHKTGEVIGNCSSGGTASFTNFIPVVCDIKPREGTTDIRLVLTKQICVKSFRFYEDEAL